MAVVIEWVSKIFVASGIGVSDFYLSTAFRFYPWIEVRILNDEWVRNLYDVFDLNVYAVSHEKDKFLAVANEEHCLDAYWCNL
jgi:hypothetical protein